MKRVHILVYGRVHGVFFRYNTNKIANSLGLNGFVRNLADGSVEVVAEGGEEGLKKLVEFCKKGPFGARVDDVKVSFEMSEIAKKAISEHAQKPKVFDKPKNEFSGFEIRY